MPKLDLTRAIRIKGAGGEIMALKGQDFAWAKPSLITDPIIAYFQSTNANGAYYTPWDKSTLFQDADGTVPVVNNNDPVGLSLDVSGNGLHRRQTVSSRRPLYRTDGTYHWLQYDGVDDYLITEPVDLSAYTSLTAAVALTKEIDTRTQVVMGIGDINIFDSTANSLALFSPGTAGTSSYRLLVRNGTQAIGTGEGVYAAAPDSNVITCYSNRNNNNQSIKAHSGYFQESNMSTATNGFSSDKSLISGRNDGSSGLFFQGRVGGSYWHFGDLSSEQRDNFSVFLAIKMGLL